MMLDIRKNMRERCVWMRGTCSAAAVAGGQSSDEGGVTMVAAGQGREGRPDECGVAAVAGWVAPPHSSNACSRPSMTVLWAAIPACLLPTAVSATSSPGPR